jgi:ParB-like chromosome segregation protein Spo0J
MKTVSPSADYVFDGLSPVRHVVTVLEGATSPLTVEAMARTYKHPNPADYTRVRRHEKCEDDEAAKRWLIRYALSELGAKQVEVDSTGYRLKLPVEEIRVAGEPIYRHQEEVIPFHGIAAERLRQYSKDDRAKMRPVDYQGREYTGSLGVRPYDPNGGIFTGNIRAREEDDLTELRESMKAFGWVPELPALEDERGVLLVGHRRMQVAKELGIDPEPFTKTIDLGQGTAADVRRLQIAIASNIGHRPMALVSRRRIAEYLCGERKWSLEQIAKALNVGKSTVGRDLARFPRAGNADKQAGNPRLDSLGRRNPGRPPKTDKPETDQPRSSRGRKQQPMEKTDRVRQGIRHLVEAGEIVSRTKLADLYGVSHLTIEVAEAYERGRREGLREAAASAVHCATCGKSVVDDKSPTTA